MVSDDQIHTLAVGMTSWGFSGVAHLEDPGALLDLGDDWCVGRRDFRFDDSSTFMSYMSLIRARSTYPCPSSGQSAVLVDAVRIRPSSGHFDFAWDCECGGGGDT